MSKKLYSETEVYPNTPLIEVVCECRFSGDLSIECNRDTYFKKIKSDYPNILIPQFSPGSALVPYRFENMEKSAGVMLSIDRFSHYTRKYKGHQKFIKEFLRLYGLLINTYGIKNFKRLGWRYINIIPYSREENLLPISEFFNLEINIAKNRNINYENLSLVLLSKIDGGNITTKIESIIKENGEQEAFLFDIDFAYTKNLKSDNIENLVQKVHKQAREYFENSIVDTYRQFLRGESL